MADTKVSNLPLGTPLSTDIFPYVDLINGISKKAYVPVKAAGSDISAGTDDAKYATAKAIHDSLVTALDGWIPAQGGWSYSDATHITVPSGAALIYSVGDKFSYIQSSTQKYGYIIGVADTLLTITGGSSYTLVSAAISNVFYSKSASPVGFPAAFNYTPTGPTNTTLSGRFSLSGRFCTAVIMGSVTGAPDFTNMPTLPITVSASQKTVAAPGLYFDSGTALRLGKIMGYVAANGTTIPLKNAELAGDMVGVSTTTPITWAASDYWTVQCVYEI